LADAREKPQCGENPLIKSSYYYSIVQQRESVQKSNSLAEYTVKTTLSNFAVNCSQTLALTRKSMQVKKTTKLHQCSPVFLGQTWPEEKAKCCPKQFGKTQSKERENLL